MYLKSYKDLIVWQKSIELVKEVYLLTSKFPKEELFGIVMQMRRAVVSIPSNIAEGYGRKYKKEFLQFLRIAYGSSLELETQIIVSKNLDFVPVSNYIKSDALLLEVLKMLNSMIAKLEAKR